AQPPRPGRKTRSSPRAVIRTTPVATKEPVTGSARKNPLQKNPSSLRKTHRALATCRPTCHPRTSERSRCGDRRSPGMAFRFTPRRAIKNCKPIHEERVAMNQRRASAVDMVHRVGAGILGIGLLVFAITGLSRGASWIGSEGQQVLGLSTNGALSVISIVAAVLLIAAALWGGTGSSTPASAFWGWFLLSGLVHLGLITTSWNPLAFRLSNVLFSLVVGLVLLFLGMYGRVSGGLPPDNPYRRRHPIRKQRPEPDEQLA